MYIYGLCDPISKELRYVGLTKSSLKERLKRHIRDSKRKHRHVQCWIRSLNEEPIIIELEKCDSYEDLKQLEIDNIAYYKFLGVNLCNHTNGGEGTVGHKVSEETKRKLAIINTGKTWSEESKAKMIKTRTGMKYRPRSPEHSKKISERMKKMWAERKRGD